MIAKCVCYDEEITTLVFDGCNNGSLNSETRHAWRHLVHEEELQCPLNGSLKRLHVKLNLSDHKTPFQLFWSQNPNPQTPTDIQLSSGIQEL